jgi:putative SOS response-associated peptidase YedK
MCGRYRLVSNENLAARFDAQPEQLPLIPRSNVAPSQSMPVIVGGERQRVVLMRWGLVPAWSKTPEVPFSTINARAEGLMKSPVFRGPFRRSRCLVPASGFYEWQRTAQGKQPYCFQLNDDELFAFAGLYDTWRDGDGNELASYSIITTTPNALIAPIHNRMPAIVRREDEQLWLDDSAKPAQLQALLAPYPAEAMEAFAVSRALNNPANEGMALFRPRVSAG